MRRLRFVPLLMLALIIVLTPGLPVFAQAPECSISIEPNTTIVTVGNEFEVKVWIRGLDSGYPMNQFAFAVAWKTTEIQLLNRDVPNDPDWTLDVGEHGTPTDPDIRFVSLDGGTITDPTILDGWWLTLRFRCLVQGEASITLPTEIRDFANNVYKPAVWDTLFPMSYGVTLSNGIVEQRSAVPSNPTQHVGGEVFTTNKAVVVAPYLMALFSVVAVAAVVVKRRRT